MAEEQITDASVETQDVSNDGIYEVDDIAEAFDNEDLTREPTEEIGAGEQEIVENSVGNETSEIPIIPQPEGWEEAMWKGLSPDVQNHINERVQAHASAIAEQERMQAELRKQHEQYALKTNSEVQQALTTMKQVIEGEYGQINWKELAQADPASYVKLQEMYKSRIDAIQQIQRNVTAQAEAFRQERQAQEAKALDYEYNTVLPEIKALVGAGFNAQNYAAQIANYMLSQGVPKEAINSVTKGYELKLATKAMLYDNILSQRASAAHKVAQAPKVTAPNGTAEVNSNNGKRGKALAALNKNPNSVDALADLFANL